MRPPRIQIADDHAVLRAGIRRLLEDDGGLSVVAESDCGKCAIRDYFQHKPDLLILDLSMPNVSGFEVLRRILAKDEAAKILILSLHDHPMIAQRALAMGARGYLSKGCDGKLLIQALHRIAAGGSFVQPELAQALAARPQPEKEATRLHTLTPREFEIFLLLAEGHGRKTIAAMLSLSVKTVDNHYRNIMAKLGLANKAALVRLAIQSGLLQSKL